MTTKFHGAILLLNSTPDNDTADAIAGDVAADHFPSQGYKYRVTSTLPENTPVDVLDQYTESMKHLPKGSTYLVVYPDDSQHTT